MKKCISVLGLLVVLQVGLPLLKSVGIAFEHKSWVLVTCLFWGPWLLLLAIGGLGLLLRHAFQEPPAGS